MSDLGQTSSLVVRRPTRHLLLLRDLVLDLGLLVELVEGVDYDGYGEGDDQDPTDGTSGSAQLSEPSPEEMRKIILSLQRMSPPGCDVSISHRRHRDDRPVQGGRHRDKLVGVSVLLHHEGQAGEYEHP